MMENQRNRNLEFGLFAAALGLALLLRLLRLGQVPLSDDEGRWAMQALDLTRGLKPALGPQPAYVLFTAVSFFIIQASNFSARLVPALFGAFLAIVPYFFRRQLGLKPAVVLAFLIAVDPGFLALSRMAGSPIIVMAAFMFAWSAWRSGNIRWAGIWLGVALLAGPLFWPGILGLLVAYGLLRGVIRGGEQLAGPQGIDQRKIVTILIAAGGTYLVLGSLFLLASGSLSAGFAAIPAYFSGWFDLNNVPVSRLTISLVAYEFMAIILAVVGLMHGIIKNDRLKISLGVWVITSLVLALAYPSRQVSDLGWVLLPLLTLAAVEVSECLTPVAGGLWETTGMVVFTSSILVFALINYSAIALVPADPSALQLRWWLIFGSLVLLLISIGMVAFGWSISTAFQGSLWGGLLILFVCSLSISIASGELRTYRTVELWSGGPNIVQTDMLSGQMNELSRTKFGLNQSLDVTIIDVDSPALRWLLRNWNVTLSSGTSLGGASPSTLITSDQFPTAEIAKGYRGLQFDWRAYPDWDHGLAADWLKWTMLHDFPATDEKLILWVRNDIFTDSQNNQ